MGSSETKDRLKELRQLCQKVAETQQRHMLWENENAEKLQLMQTAHKELRELKISVALVQLDLVAPHEIADKASMLTIVGNTRELRQFILNIVSDLEQYLRSIDRTKPDIDNIERSVKTVSILIELLDSVES